MKLYSPDITKPTEVNYYWHEKVLVEPMPKPKEGEWIAKDGVFYCSCCDNDSAGLSEDDVYVYERPLPNYCQDCGAKMKGVDDDRI